MKKTFLIKSVAAALLLAAGSHGWAGEEMLDVETHWRAKIAKEKLKQAARERADSASGDGREKDNNNTQCGSQNIGNVDTGGRPGSGPREVFIFAPNAMNIVGRGGCR